MIWFLMKYIFSQMGWAFISKLVRSTVGLTETDNLSNAGARDDSRYTEFPCLASIFTEGKMVLHTVSNSMIHFSEFNALNYHWIFYTLVLPSFSGNVPAALTKIFPSAKITRLGDWYFTSLFVRLFSSQAILVSVLVLFSIRYLSLYS